MNENVDSDKIVQNEMAKCDWRNTDHREGAHSIEKPFAWAEVRGGIPLPLCVLREALAEEKYFYPAV